MYTPDGAIIPSWLGVVETASLTGIADTLNNFNSTIKVGYVVDIHLPPEQNATETTYDVLTRSSVGLEASAWHLYTNVRVAAGIGGTDKEYTRVRLRAPKRKYKREMKGEELKTLLKEATTVIIQCENGFSQFAIIVGFSEHPDLIPDDKTLGHYWTWKFNGINSTINKDGEYLIEFTGAILDENTNFHIVPPENTTGTFLKFLKDGSWTVDDAKGESITLDKTNTQIAISARNMVTNITEQNYSLNTKNNVDIQAENNAIFNGKKVYIGKEGSKDPLVKGNELVEALDQLVRAFVEVPLIGQAGPFPCFLHPNLKGKLMAWKNVYSRKNRSPFLSKKGYVE